MSFLSKLFGSEKKDTTYSGAKPFGSISQAMGGKETYDELIRRLSGRGVGYSDGYASLANPAVQKSRSQFQSYQLPELYSELSASGRRGGTGGFDQIRRAYQEQGQNEDVLVADLMQRQEEAAREDKNNALLGLERYSINDSNARNNLANFDYADNARQVGEATQRRDNESAGWNRLGQAATQMLLGGASPMTSAFSVQPKTSFSYGQQFNPQAPQNNIGYGKSGNSLAQRLSQRAALSGRY